MQLTSVLMMAWLHNVPQTTSAGPEECKSKSVRFYANKVFVGRGYLLGP
jgi:hypothetical protein